jgi:peroxiredoxin Q/BCP
VCHLEYGIVIDMLFDFRRRKMSKLEVGQPAPEFRATADSGEQIRLSDYLGQRVVLYFYPKDDTPGCTTQACSFRDAYPEIEEQNAVVLGVSPDGSESHQKFRTKHDLPFTLLVDEDHSISDAYGTWGEKSMYGKKYMGVIRSQFVIDEAGNLIDVQYKISPKKSVPAALKALG